MLYTNLDDLKSLPILRLDGTTQTRQVFPSGLRESQIKNTKTQLFDIQIWTIDELALAINCSKGTIYNKVSRNEIPFHKKGRKGRLYFIPSEILDWIKREEFQ